MKELIAKACLMGDIIFNTTGKETEDLLEKFFPTCEDEFKNETKKGSHR